jgi:hypothetical protein
MSRAMICSSTCVSSGTAAAMHPPRVYAAPQLSPRPTGRRSPPRPTLRPAARGVAGVRSIRSDDRDEGLRGPRRSGHAAPAVVPATRSVPPRLGPVMPSGMGRPGRDPATHRRSLDRPDGTPASGGLTTDPDRRAPAGVASPAVHHTGAACPDARALSGAASRI